MSRSASRRARSASRLCPGRAPRPARPDRNGRRHRPRPERGGIACRQRRLGNSTRRCALSMGQVSRRRGQGGLRRHPHRDRVVSRTTSGHRRSGTRWLGQWLDWPTESPTLAIRPVFTGFPCGLENRFGGFPPTSVRIPPSASRAGLHRFAGGCYSAEAASGGHRESAGDRWKPPAQEKN